MTHYKMKLMVTLSLAFLVLSCSAQKEQIFRIDQKAFNDQAKEYLDSGMSKGLKTVVLLKEDSYNKFYYFIFKSYTKDYPAWLNDYLQDSNKYLEIGDFKIPLFTSLDYALLYNKEISNLPKKGVVQVRGYTYLDGTILGSSDRFIIVLENDQGRFGKIVPKDDLLEP
ncbi:MAG: hypothetical protein RLP14_02655 [Owenweeksia sp.]